MNRLIKSSMHSTHVMPSAARRYQSASSKASPRTTTQTASLSCPTFSNPLTLRSYTCMKANLNTSNHLKSTFRRSRTLRNFTTSVIIALISFRLSRNLPVWMSFRFVRWIWFLFTHSLRFLASLRPLVLSCQSIISCMRTLLR